MLVLIEGVLDEEAAARLERRLEEAPFEDGRRSAGWAAQDVKRNAQAARDPLIDDLREQVQAALSANPVFALAAQPKRIIGPLFSRYRAGDAYGTHVDEPILDGARADLSFTLFLSKPDSYDGGELVIETAAGEDAVKGGRGALVLYPSSTLHRVAPVTRGVRHAAAGWVRSLVRDPRQRELLYDLETARRALFAGHGKTREFDLLSKCYANLIRLWAED